MTIASKLAAAWLLALTIISLAAPRAGAVPAFAAQTGEPCQACHVGGYGPQLTAFGREFKLQGYTLRTNSFNVPLSAMVIASYVNTAKAQPPQPGFSANDNLALDQFSLFLAGGWGQHLGAFIQTTYDGVAKAWHWDNLDVRAVAAGKVKSADVTVGLSLNNSPGVEDAWNTLPAWGYPYTTSSLAPSPSASPLLNAALAQTSLGLTAYAWVNSEFYAEAGGYWSPDATTLTRLGVDPTDPGSIQGVAPYGRLAFQHDLRGGTLELGMVGMQTRINPGLDRTTGLTDHYDDLGVDGSYVIARANGDVASVNARIVNEHQNLEATCALAMAASDCANVRLTDYRADASYYWRDQIGLTVSGFDTTGAPNALLYTGNPGLSPDSSGVMLQLDGTPYGAGGSPLGARFNTRLGVQYTAYAQFNGDSHHAGDNNTLRLFAWVAY